MKKRLFLWTMLIIILGLLAFLGASVFITSKNNLAIAEDTVIEVTGIYSGLYDPDVDLDTFVSTARDTRITVVSSTGRVLADSRPIDLDGLDNHLDRPEIQAALAGTPTTSVRHSASLGVDYIYYALKVDSGDDYVFIRAAVPVAKIDSYLSKSLPLFIILVVGIAVLCVLFVRTMIARITRPFLGVETKLRHLSHGDYIHEPIEDSYEEIEAIIQGIDEVSEVLSSSFTDLSDEKAKLDYVLSNIADAIFVVDENLSITLINSAALSIFETTDEIVDKNVNYLTGEKPLVEMVTGAVEHQEDSLFELSLEGRIFLTAVKRLPLNSLTMVVLSDVTENRENAKRREELFANASHELKTPMTAIKGFTELAVLNNGDPGLTKYLEGITRETDRMLSLIGDILKLSELETNPEVSAVETSLAGVVEEVRQTLASTLEEKTVTVTIEGDARVSADPTHLYELVKNIIENAVIYNQDGGEVEVTIVADKEPRMVVIDSGIGISPEEQSRIFERFYRVEKSRSSRGGGTGLGLAIIKHICALYGWQVSLKSKLGVGTQIDVVFGS
ncbi:MAG: ATP-binding protein [Propionibacteriaceae bacterium]|nr:ATP-binding protein [Propionibacteriaceae bacterium]